MLSKDEHSYIFSLCMIMTLMIQFMCLYMWQDKQLNLC